MPGIHPCSKFLLFLTVISLNLMISLLAIPCFSPLKHQAKIAADDTFFDIVSSKEIRFDVSCASFA